MPNIFGADIAGKIAKGLGGKVFATTLTVTTPGTRTGGQLTAGTQPTSVAHACRGFVDVLKDRYVGGGTEDERGGRTIVQRGDRTVVILGGTLPAGVVPEPNNTITIEGETLRVVLVFRDPASAAYECEVK